MRAINDISATALLTLKCHAVDAAMDQPILNNQEAIERIQFLSKYLNYGVPEKVNRKMVTHIALRAKKYDEVARAFISRHPNGTIVNVGCGFDSRFERVNNGQITFFDLDLPEVINIKKRMVQQTQLYRFLSNSVFEEQWMSALPGKPVLLLAEGVFMYCQEKEVKKLFSDLGRHFGAYEFLFEVFNKKWTKGWKKKLVDFKLKKELHFGKDASFTFGIAHSDDLEHWDPRLHLVNDWSYLDSDHPSIGSLRLLRNFELFRKMQWSVHYEFKTLSQGN